MFKAKFEDVNMNSQPLKATAAKGLRAKALETFPKMEPYIDEFWKNKAKVHMLKLKGDNTIHWVKIEETVCFIEFRDKGLIPMLRLLHKYPDMMDHMLCDKGAIRHIFSSSNVMAPGLTSEGGKVCPDLPKGAPVAITAEGKKHAMGVGFLE